MEQNQIPTYCHAAEVIKTAILQGQYEALKDENRIQLAVYFGIGKYVSKNSRKGTWGTGALDAISERLRKILPGLRGFSAESLKKMRQFYENWTMLDCAPTVENVNKNNSVIAITGLEDESKSVIAITDSEESEIDIYHGMSIPNTVDFPASEFLAVPFTHHSRILAKMKTLPTAKVELAKLEILIHSWKPNQKDIYLNTELRRSISENNLRNSVNSCI